MTVKKLIEELSYYNPNAIVTVGDNLYNGISISISGGDGCTKLDCDLYPELTWKDEPIEAEIFLKVASDALREDIEIRCIDEKEE